MANEPMKFDEVFVKELAAVDARRNNVGVATRANARQTELATFIQRKRQQDLGLLAEAAQSAESWDPRRWPLIADNEEIGQGRRDEVAPRQLVGLALSGGGIRSAATCIGAMQALDRCGVMRLVDYLSSVSGGGYAAACLNANITGLQRERAKFPAPPVSEAEVAARKAQGQWTEPPPSGWLFPLSHERGIRENTLFRYLRANAQFLIPRGKMLEYGFAPVMLLRGLFLNLWAMLPVVLALSAVTVAMLAIPYVRTPVGASHVLGATAAMIMILWAAFFVISRPIRNMLEGQSRYAAWSVLLATGVVVTGAAWCIDRVAGLTALLLVLATAGIEAGRQRAFTKETAADKVAADGDLDPAPGIARESFRQAQAQAMMVSFGGLFIALQPAAAIWMGGFLITGDPGNWAAGLSFATFATTWLGRFEKLPAIVRKGLLLIAATLAGPLLLWGGSLVISAAIALHGGLWSYPDLGLWFTHKPLISPHDWQGIAGKTSYALAYAVLLLVIAWILWRLNDLFFYDANEASPHSYYRDKIGATFLFSANPGNPEHVVKHPDLKLSAMDTTVAPFPLINAALNFVDRDAYRGRGRNAAFFTFSPLHIGGTLAGFVPTSDLEKVNSRLRLSSAIAISGAAASANMGRNTNPAFRFLLALVNVRLGYWLANPTRVAKYPEEFERRFWRNGRPRPGAGALIREMVGDLTTTRKFVNLSDGGHLENLGIYELVRRRCRVIIAIDAEQDGDMAFRALGDVVRFCRIDHAAAIDLDTREIRPDEKGISKRCYALGRIDYGHGDCGWLVYVKNCLTGSESASIRKYKAIEPAFPHHNTGDQFFDEEQFEAYRELGFHMLTDVFGKFLQSVSPPEPETG